MYTVATGPLATLMMISAASTFGGSLPMVRVCFFGGGGAGEGLIKANKKQHHINQSHWGTNKSRLGKLSERQLQTKPGCRTRIPVFEVCFQRSNFFLPGVLQLVANDEGWQIQNHSPLIYDARALVPHYELTE